MDTAVKAPTPIFIFSLPRSGSTLLQRILAAHPAVATLSESHLLLPFVYTLRERGVYSEYDHGFTVMGIQDLCRALPGGVADYKAEIRALALRLYARAAGPDATYFVDKAGAYHLIVDEIFELFPEARCIFLWRNPLAVAASLLASWSGGRWNLFHYEQPLYEGLPQLVAAYRQRRARVLALRYEDVLLQPDEALARLFAYLELPYDPALKEQFAGVALAGRTGDQVGMGRYRQLSREPLDKWQQTLVNPLRRAWARRYVQRLGAELLAEMGYDQAELLAAVAGIRPSARYLASDLWRRPFGVLYRVFEGRIARDKVRDWRAGRRLVVHR
ncbi:MAG: sulfotransferase [Anaerolineales bacterium]|nr:sulfotransferase [Anaerolineales bacterium]